MSLSHRAQRLQQIPGIGVDRIGNLADALRDPNVLRLENMDTDLLPPADALNATRQAIDKDENNSYLPFWGQESLRKAIVNGLATRHSLFYDWQTECVISAGGLSGILNTLLTVLDPGDEVILTDPVYAGLINRIRLAGGVTKFVPLIPTDDGWRLDLQALTTAVTSKTRMVLMVSPSLPTGHVLTLEEWHAVAHICKQADAWLLYDACMERIVFDGRNVIHPATLPDMHKRTIICGSVTKEYRMIGWRVGWVVGPKELIKDVGLVGITNVVCQVGIAMPGAAAALTSRDDGIAHSVAIWQQRRDVMLQELAGLPVIKPHGGWSFLLDCSKLQTTPQEVSTLLLSHAKIATTPMSGWGDTASNYLRFVFANEPQERLHGMGAKVRRALKI